MGRGEREVLTLAQATLDALVLLDDVLARAYTQKRGIPMNGTLGILLKAKQAGYIKTIEPILNTLENLGFRLSSGTRQAVLKLANEI